MTEDGGLRTEDGGRRTEGGGQSGEGKDSGQRSVVSGQKGKDEKREELTLKVLRKHIKRLVNYAEAGDGEKIREELRRIVPEYHAQRAWRMAGSGKGRAHRAEGRDTPVPSAGATGQAEDTEKRQKKIPLEAVRV